MENGTTGWGVLGSGTLSSTTSPAHGGARSLAITGRTASWNGPSQDVTSKLTNGKSYATSAVGALAERHAEREGDAGGDRQRLDELRPRWLRRPR